jgi:hypothetical protein
MAKPTKQHPLIEECPDDTLLNCADVLAYLKNQETNPEETSLGTAEHNGRFYILKCVEFALRYEAERPVSAGQSGS